MNCAPLRANTFPLVSLSWLNDIRRYSKIRLQQEIEPKLFIHQREGYAMGEDIATSLDADGFEEPLVDPANTLNFADGQIMHEANYCFAIEREVKLAIGLILV